MEFLSFWADTLEGSSSSSCVIGPNNGNQFWQTVLNCAPPATTTTTTPTATTRPTTTVPTTTAPVVAAATCFHIDTLITYKGVEHKLADLQKHSDCSVPHVFESSGVIIETECSHKVRMTGDHLVYTTRGLVAAETVRKDDSVFTSIDGDKTCRVRSISSEKGQRYFGLNCRESIVLANGIKASTFGRYHTIPAMWMKYAGALVGPHRASKIGDAVAQFLVKIEAI